MNVTRAAIENNRVTAVALIVILFAGIQVYDRMPRNEDPGFIIRTAQVLTFFPGASPERVELLVSDKLEKAIEEIPQLDFVNSTSRTGVSEIFVNIQESERQLRPIWDDLRRKVERASRELPDGVIGPLVNDEFGDVFGTIATLTGEGYSYMAAQREGRPGPQRAAQDQGCGEGRDSRNPGRADLRRVQQRPAGGAGDLCGSPAQHPTESQHPVAGGRHKHRVRAHRLGAFW